MANLIRLKNEDTLRELLDAMLDLREKIIYIDIPLASAIWQPEALRLLRRAGREADKKIVVVSSNRVGRIRAEQAGLTALTPESARENVRGVAKIQRKVGPKTLSESPAEWITRKAKGVKTGAAHAWGKNRKLLFFGSALLALAAGLSIANFAFQKAEITVQARTQITPGDQDIILNKLAKSANPENKTIRAVPVEKTYTRQAGFPATGTKNSGGSAFGTVILHSTQPTTLKLRQQTTYLEAPNGRRYRFKSDVAGLQPNLPKTVEVVSEQGGENGNLPSGARLEVHNSAFGYRPNVLYATVGDGGITGGENLAVKVVSDSDLAQAHDKLKNAMLEELKSQILETEGKDFVLSEELTRFKVLSESADAKADDRRESFTLSLTANIAALIFDKKDAALVVDSYARKQLDSSQTYLGSNIGEYAYSARSWNFEEGIAVLNVGYSSRSAAKLSESDLKVLLAGRTAADIKSILLNKPEIENVRIKLTPFWMRSTPKSPDNIRVKIILN